MKQFEYMVIDWELINEHNLSKHGEQGWELVCVYRDVIVFKREKL